MSYRALPGRGGLPLLSLLGAGLLLGGCPDVVHIHLEPGECEESGVRDVMSVYAELTRTDRSTSYHVPCLNTLGLLADLQQIEELLATFPPFDDVPAGGTWNLWVVGRSSTCDDSSDKPPLTLLCGRMSEVPLPPAGDDLRLTIDCESRVSSSEQLQRIKEKIKACEAGLFPWR